MAAKTYSEQLQQEYLILIRDILSKLPLFCSDFFRGIEPRTSVRTRLGYAYDLKCFFEFIISDVDEFKKISEPRKFSLDDVQKITPVHIERFLEYTTLYVSSDTKTELTNSEKGKGRKLAALRSMYKYLIKNKSIYVNPAALVDTPKIHEKPIVRLEANEVADLLDLIESGEKLTSSQKKYHEINKTRDLALIGLLLGTGMRVSEGVGIDIKDIDFENNSVKVTRKGGNQVILYFPDEVKNFLEIYTDYRKSIIAESGHENAFFLSMQKKRITVRAVENLVKKYAKLISPLKNISPHKLRSTFGTNLYRETGDIYLVADVLGHRDVNTTRKHYAAIADDQRRIAAKIIKLRDE